MEIKKKQYFIEALMFTLIIFLIGFLMGFNIEEKRNFYLDESYSEIQNLLNNLRGEINNSDSLSCEGIIKNNSEIGNKIYEQAFLFAKYEDAAIITKKQIVKDHKRFDELRTLFWINSIAIKEKCGEATLKTIVYLYDYPAESAEERAKQAVMSSIALNIKELNETNVLIPIAKNLGAEQLNKLISNYTINDSAIIIINEKEIYDMEKAINLTKEH